MAKKKSRKGKSTWNPIANDRIVLDLGTFKVSSRAVLGFIGTSSIQIYAREIEAVNEAAVAKLSQMYTEVFKSGPPTFYSLMVMMRANPDIFDAAVRLARFQIKDH
jgi:hypothetical protein